MRLDAGSGPIVLTLSRRNLVALLAKLDGRPAGSECSILGGSDAKGVLVHAEPDEVHYRGRPAGRMHPETEKAMSS